MVVHVGQAPVAERAVHMAVGDAGVLRVAVLESVGKRVAGRMSV
jgi:hypothetical protein